MPGFAMTCPQLCRFIFEGWSPAVEAMTTIFDRPKTVRNLLPQWAMKLLEKEGGLSPEDEETQDKLNELLLGEYSHIRDCFTREDLEKMRRALLNNINDDIPTKFYAYIRGGDEASIQVIPPGGDLDHCKITFQFALEKARFTIDFVSKHEMS